MQGWLDELAARSHVLSLHCPLTPETEKMVNATRLALMKRGAYLVNTARGGLVDDLALTPCVEGRRFEL